MTRQNRNGITQPDKPSPVAVATGGRTYVVGSLLLQTGRQDTLKEIATGLSRCKPEPERFALTLQAVPGWGDVPAAIRLKRFLKMPLRAYGLKCTECREHARPCPMPPDGPSINPPAKRGTNGQN
jgi:hypothetical protein